MTPSAQDIAEWLQNNPQFFEDYADLIAEIFIPHPHGGRAIPIAERQILTLREKNRLIEDKMNELLMFGEENGLLNQKVHKLGVAMIQAQDLAALLGSVYHHLGEHFGIAHHALRLWGGERDATLLEYSPVSAAVEELARSMEGVPYCGPHVSEEVLSWLGDAGGQLKSFAQVVLLDDGAPVGLLVLGHEDPQHYLPDMGKIYLTRIGELISAAIARCRP